MLLRTRIDLLVSPVQRSSGAPPSAPHMRRREGKTQAGTTAGGDSGRQSGASGAGASAVGSPRDLLKGMAAGCGLLLLVFAAVWISRGGAALGSLRGAGDKDDGPRVFTPEELQAEGSGKSGQLLLAVLGEVFDVSAGTQFYAEGEHYNCFVGRDASRAFVTGEFEGDGLTNDVEGLEPSQLAGILHWRGFYRDSDKYSAVGVLTGPFYDAAGERVPGVLDSIEEKVAEWQAAEAAQKAAFPPCNSKWTQAGSNVWCTSKSGGEERYARLLRPLRRWHTHSPLDTDTARPGAGAGSATRGKCTNEVRTRLARSACVRRTPTRSCRVTSCSKYTKDVTSLRTSVIHEPPPSCRSDGGAPYILYACL